MAHLHATTLLDSPLVRVHDVVCRAPRSGCGEEEHVRSVRLMLPRRGVFALHRGRELIAAEPATAFMLREGDSYRVSHPVDGGDACTVLAYAPEIVEDALGDRPRAHGPLRPATQLRARALAVAAADPLAGEETALGLLAAIAEDLGAPSPVTLGPLQRRRVEQARLLLAARPGDPWRLQLLADTLGCSPFHLARQFRAASGETIAGALRRIRLALALERLAAGEDDLARLAVDLGFAHHSHFTARFRAAFGVPPSTARTIVTAGGGRRA